MPAAAWIYCQAAIKGADRLNCVSRFVLTDRTRELHRYTIRKGEPLYGYWFFEAYYESFGKQLALISPKFMPETAAAVDELLSFMADM